jgi:hypothetical protein
MKVTPTVRFGMLCLSCVLLVVFVSGCCTCKITTDPKVIVIVHRPDAVAPTPEGALYGFAEELKDGDKIRLINKFGKTVTVTFPDNVIAGEKSFDIKRCDERVVTVSYVGTPPPEILINFKGGPGHGSAKIIVDPG